MTTSGAGRRVILVTGTPRSGTTPVGDALAVAPGVRTLYEPLNRHVGDRRVRTYFEVPGSDGFSTALADSLIADIAALRLHLRPGVFPEDRGMRRALKRITGSRTLVTYRLARLDRRASTLVWKDPFGAFLAARAATVHDVPVLVTFRPAEAVAASFKRLGWSFDVTGLVARLGSDGARYSAVLDDVDLTRPAHNAAALWYVVNDWLLRAAEQAPGIAFVDMDRLVQDRVGTFRALYTMLGLPWTPRTQAHLSSAEAGAGPATPQTTRAHGGKRDPAAVNRYWVDVLDAEEAARVTQLTAGVASRLRDAAVLATSQPHPELP